MIFVKCRLEKVKKILKEKLEELFTVRNYFIDFENVQSAGLKGIEKLKKNDRVYFLYSKNASTIHIDAARKIHESIAEIEFIDIKHLGKNALDFQLCTLMGEKIGKFRGKNLELYIVSNDTGYDSVKHGTYEMFKEAFKKKGKFLTIRRICNCENMIDAEEKKARAEEKKEQTEKEMKEIAAERLKKEQIEKAKKDLAAKQQQLITLVSNALKGSPYMKNTQTVVDLLMQKKNKNTVNFHNECCKAFGSDDGRAIYKLLQPSLK